MELLSIAALLLGFLALLLGAGVWIAVALMATGWRLRPPLLPVAINNDIKGRGYLLYDFSLPGNRSYLRS